MWKDAVHCGWYYSLGRGQELCRTEESQKQASSKETALTCLLHCATAITHIHSILRGIPHHFTSMRTRTSGPQKLGVAVCTCNLKGGKAETGRYLGLSQPVQSVSSKPMKDPVSKKMGRVPEDDPCCCLLASTPICTCIHTCIKNEHPWIGT